MRKFWMTPVLAVAVASCAGRNNNPIDNAAQAVKDPGLQGKIFARCSQDRAALGAVTGLMTGGQQKVASSEEKYEFTGANVTRTTTMYNTNDCSGDPAYSFQELGSFTIHDDQKTNDDARFLDMNFDRVSVHMDSAAGAQVANSVKLCGSSDWAADQDRDVTQHAKDVNCAHTQVPSVEKNVYRLENDDLLLGKPDMVSANSEDRPTKVDRDGAKFSRKNER